MQKNKPVSKLTDHGAEIVNMSTSSRATLQDILGPIDEARMDLHRLCQTDHTQILADIFRDLTIVADKIYLVAYMKERD